MHFPIFFFDGGKMMTESEKPGRSEVLDQRRALQEQSRRATLDTHCDHTNLNAHKTRCLSCGLWMETADAV